MFQVKHSVSARNAAKSSEARRMRRELAAAFPLLSDPQLDSIWPNNATLEILRLDAPDRLTGYSVDGCPLFFSTSTKVENKMRLWPSLYLLHAAPQILPEVTVHAGVGKKLCGGADLFMPGVIADMTSSTGGLNESWVRRNFGRFQRGDMAAIVERGHGAGWHAVALGTWSLHWDELEMRGMTGRGMDICHSLGDTLWTQGNGSVPAARPESANEALVLHREAIEAEKRAEEAAEATRQYQAAEVARATLLADGPKKIKKLEKNLRQIADLAARVQSGAVVPDDDQKAKLARRSDIETDLHELRLSLEIAAAAAAAPTPAPPAAADNITTTITAAATTDGGGDTEAVVIKATEETSAAAATAAADVRAPATAATATATAADADATFDTTTAIATTTTATTISADTTEATRGKIVVDDLEVEEEVEVEVEEEVGVSQDDLLVLAFLQALHDTVSNKDLPLLVSSLMAQHISPACRRLGVEVNVKKTKYRKLGTFLGAMAETGLVKIAELKKGVQQLVSVDRAHTIYLSHDNEAHLAASALAEDAAAAAARRKGPTPKPWTMPKSGSRKIEVSTRRRGNKFVVAVRYLAHFGLPLDDTLRREAGKKFSGAATYASDPEKIAGDQLIIQSRSPEDVGKWLMQRFQLPSSVMAIEGGKKKGKRKGGR